MPVGEVEIYKNRLIVVPMVPELNTKGKLCIVNDSVINAARAIYPAINFISKSEYLDSAPPFQYAFYDWSISTIIKDNIVKSFEVEDTGLVLSLNALNDLSDAELLTDIMMDVTVKNKFIDKVNREYLLKKGVL